MAIKTKESRDTYRSNVKVRPLQQNGLEAQYQGLDITEVNIDHAGLAIIGRGGFQTRRNIRKVQKQYIVDVAAEEHRPTAEIIFEQDAGSPFIRGTGTAPTIQDLASDSAKFRITPQTGSAVTFQYTASGTANGVALGNGNIAIDVKDNTTSIRDVLINTRESIKAAFPENTFSFHIYQIGSVQELPDGSKQEITEDKIHITANTVVNTGTTLNLAISLPDNYDYFDVTTNQFGDQADQHEWRLNGFLKDNSNERMFYEDIRVDTIQSVAPHSVRRSGSLFRLAQFPRSNPRSNYDANIGSKGTAGIAGDPTTLDRFTTHDSAEVLIRQYPKREEILGTHKDYFKWHEDPHYVLPDQQTWSLMTMYAEMYGSTLSDQITRMFEQIYVSDQYVDHTPMSGRVDVFERLSRTFDLHPMQTFERHRYSVFTQYLDPIDDFVNIRENRFPKEDCSNGDVAFEDVRGTRSPLPALDTVFDTNGDVIKSRYTMNFFQNWNAGRPADGDSIKLKFGNGYLDHFFITIKFNHNGTHDTSVNPVGASTVEYELNIDVVGQGSALNTNDELATLIASRLNSFSKFGNYVAVAITEGTWHVDISDIHEMVIITAVNAGAQYDITNMGTTETGNYVSYPQDFDRRVSGIDSLYARDNSMMFIDYFDQEPLDSHDYIEEERYTRIDDTMLDILTFNANRGTHIDKREWQQSAYVHTATGFINSQVTGQDGIIYREMKR